MRRAALSFAAAVAGALLGATASQAQVSDLAVKAAFLPKFARYVSWPASALAHDGQLVLCVIGDDPFGNMLNDAVAGQQVDGHGFVVRRLSSAAGAADCAIAFVDGPRTAEILAALGHSPVLTVTDSRSSTQHGIIHFAILGGRVRFYIDEAQAQARGLTISSRLLALAIRVNQR